MVDNCARFKANNSAVFEEIEKERVLHEAGRARDGFGQLKPQIKELFEFILRNYGDKITL